VQLVLVKRHHLHPQGQQQLLHLGGFDAVPGAFWHQSQLQAGCGAETDDGCPRRCVEQGLAVALLQQQAHQGRRVDHDRAHTGSPSSSYRASWSSLLVRPCHSGWVLVRAQMARIAAFLAAMASGRCCSRAVMVAFLLLLPLQGLAAWRGLEAAQSLA